MVWHATREPRKPDVIITVHVTRFGKMHRRVYARAPSPGRFLDATFKYVVADPPRRLLDPLGASISQPTSCS